MSASETCVACGGDVGEEGGYCEECDVAMCEQCWNDFGPLCRNCEDEASMFA